MNLFFDLEFTGLRKDTTLISIGIVAEDGKKFYAELFDYDRDQCDDWIKENVINNLKFKNPKEHEQNYYVVSRYKNNPIPSDLYKGYSVELQGNKKEVAQELSRWISQFDSVQFVSDVCHYDMVLLIDLFGTAFDLPDNVSPVCHDINADIARHYGISERKAFDKSREEIVSELCGKQIEGEKHNSLYDAEVIKAIYEEIS